MLHVLRFTCHASHFMHFFYKQRKRGREGGRGGKEADKKIEAETKTAKDIKRGGGGRGS